ncbi:MAG: AsmA family protein [Rhizobiales bacterium]|nr:AsmA family protein [Hyphomicrobiales bacterium]NRB13958.1 AsmA family protein [Hyphomicrobiales bacterium]
MNNFLVAIAGFIVAVLLAVLFVPFLINWNSFKAEIEAVGQKITGQNVRIIGDVELRILPQPVFYTGGLEITNANGDKLLETADFVLELDFPSLLRAKIEITSMHLNDGKIFVAKTDGKALNLFDFGSAIGQPIGLEDISIKKLLLNNMDVEFTNEVSQAKKNISIAQAEVTARSLKGPFKMKGMLNVEVNDAVVQREFFISTGRYVADKPLTVKAQIMGEQKRSKLQFLGTLVGLETHPLLVGELVVRGQAGEDLIGYGQTTSSKLSDALYLTGNLSLDYSVLKLENFKFAMGSQALSSQSGRELTDGLKMNGDFTYKWGRSPSLNGAVNIGIADFDYLKKQLLTDEQLSQAEPIYKSMQRLTQIGRNWFADHISIATDGDDLVQIGMPFSGNVSLNIEQLSFLQNQIVDRVRRINALLNINDSQITVQQFSASFPGNSKLSYQLRKQSLGETQSPVLVGEFDFAALDFQKLTNWLLFQNNRPEGIVDFWGLNDQLTAKGNIQLSRAGVEISSNAVRTRKYEYSASYNLANNVHNLEVNFDRVSFDNDDLLGFQNYIAPYMRQAFTQSSQADASIGYHLVPADLVNELGPIKLKLHSDQSYYGIRDLGILDIELLFEKDTTHLNQLAINGDKIIVKASASLPHNFVAKNILDESETKPILEFSIVDADMIFTPQLVYNTLLEGNLFLDKIIPLNGPLSLKGMLTPTTEEGGFYLEVEGEMGTSELGIGVDIQAGKDGFKQQNIQYQLNNSNSLNLAGHFDLSALLTDVDAASDDGVVNLFIAQSEADENQQDAKFLALLGDQKIELIASITDDGNSDNWKLLGDTNFKIADLGLVARKLNLFGGNLNQLMGGIEFDGNVEIAKDYVKIQSANVDMLNTHFDQFEIEVKNQQEVSFNAKTSETDIFKLLSFLTGENNRIEPETISFLDDSAKQVIESAQDLFAEVGGTGTDRARGFNLKLLEGMKLNGKIIADKLHISDSFSIKNAEILFYTKAGEAALYIAYNGEFYNTTLAGEFVLRPTDGQLYMDVLLRSFALDVAQVATGLGLNNQYITGLIDIDIDLTGQGYSVDGLLSNLAGIVDVDLKNLQTQYIDSQSFNQRIAAAASEDEIQQILAGVVGQTSANANRGMIKILPEKISLKLMHGLASIAHEVEFQKSTVGAQLAMFSGQFDLSNNSSQFTLQIPLSDEDHVPKVRLDWQNVEGKNSELVSYEDIAEYYRVKLLEKNVERLEELQIEIKRKNDAEIARYTQEKIEAEAFKAEIKDKVETAIADRKLREIAATTPPAPKSMPFKFVTGTVLRQDFIAPNTMTFATELTQNSLGVADIKQLVLAEETKLLVAKLAAEKLIAEQLAAEQLIAEEAQKAADIIREAERAAKLEQEAAAAAEVSDIADLLDTPDALTDDEIINADDLFLDNDFGASADFGTGLDIGSLTEQDSLEFDANSQNSLGLSNGDLQPNDEVNVISIEPLPAN